MVCSRRLTALAALFVIAPPIRAAGASASAHDVDPRVRTELDIIPMPKEIRLTDQDLALDPGQVAIVLGGRKCRQSEIGAEWINKRVGEMGGHPLPVVSERRHPRPRTALVIGVPEGNGLISLAVNERLVNVGKNNPGKRGYYYELHGLAFREDVRAGELRLRLESREAAFEHRVRIEDRLPVIGMAKRPVLHANGAVAEHACAGADGAYVRRADTAYGLYYLNRETGFVLYPEGERWVLSSRLGGERYFERDGRIEGRYTNVLGAGKLYVKR